MVTKNPCMHPGDVRKFRAVNVRSLHHIVDCIVFPQRGHRPHPNEMAGLYFIKILLFLIKNNVFQTALE